MVYSFKCCFADRAKIVFYIGVVCLQICFRVGGVVFFSDMYVNFIFVGNVLCKILLKWILVYLSSGSVEERSF